jgi:uncharacterized protein YecE (DUF72 family)
MKALGKTIIGTSGWHYMHWVGKFYPENTRPKDFKDLYVKQFNTVELNSPFYHLPSAETFQSWKNSTPDSFIFSVKASRFITHMKKLKDPIQTFGNFIQNADHLEEKLGPILFQLPPKWNYNKERFEAFLDALPKNVYRYTFEFRNQTWYNEEVYELLEKHKVAYCIYELEYHQTPLNITADFIYIRLHGPEKKYSGNYSDEVLSSWAEKCIKWNADGKDVYIYFDNDQNAYAAFNALKLIDLVKTFRSGE